MKIGIATLSAYTLSASTAASAAAFSAAALAIACGPSWTNADAQSATDVVHDAVQLHEACATDAAACNAPQVRAVARAMGCAAAAQLQRHGEDVPDAGVRCAP